MVPAVSMGNGLESCTSQRAASNGGSRPPTTATLPAPSSLKSERSHCAASDRWISLVRCLWWSIKGVTRKHVLTKFSSTVSDQNGRLDFLSFIGVVLNLMLVTRHVVSFLCVPLPLPSYKDDRILQSVSPFQVTTIFHQFFNIHKVLQPLFSQYCGSSPIGLLILCSVQKCLKLISNNFISFWQVYFKKPWRFSKMKGRN